ncbi:DJ-1/PfpI family protein [Tepidicaulis sp. LMO-SS28]|uniref:DJ-1/PfpI family protein n=1 Tax=Tepidicaulis sp. LMO-SS28 TaxID=3447455 RepID=UPI003EE156E0
MTMHVQIILFDGFDLLDALAPFEVFEAAGLVSEARIEVELVSMDGARPVPSAPGGLAVPAVGTPDLDKADLILIPGAAGPVQPDVEGSLLAILAREAEGPIPELAKKAFARDDVTIVAVCGGALILGMGGAITGRNAVTHFMGMPTFAATGVRPVQARVVDDGNLISGGGVTSGLDVALHVVDRFIGPKVAHGVEYLFEYERRGIVWRADGPDVVGLDRQEESDEIEEKVPQSAGAPVADHPVVGRWRLRIHTPIGVQEVDYDFWIGSGGAIGGRAQQGDDAPVEVENVVVSENRITWSQRITKPLKLDLRFDVVILENALTGAAKAGVLPSSRVEGVRAENHLEDAG